MGLNEITENKIARSYLIAKKYIIGRGFSKEIDWQEDILFERLNYQSFLQEYCWVVLCSGLSDKVVSKIFPKLMTIFNGWETEDISKIDFENIYINCLRVFNHKGKIKAVLNTMKQIHNEGFDNFKLRIFKEGRDYLLQLPYIGESTSYHLAKNIGFNCGKPDRHLVRISKTLGYESTSHLCAFLAEMLSEKAQVVDLVIWRYATIDKNYLYKVRKLVM